MLKSKSLLVSLMALVMVIFAAGCSDGSAPDTTQPSVVSTIPAAGEGGVALNQILSVVFSENIVQGTLSGSVMRGSTVTVVEGLTYFDGNVGSFQPRSELLPNTVYTITVSSDCKNLNGHTLGADYIWSFTTGAGPDAPLLSVVSTIPAASEQGVALDQILSVVFSENIDQGTLTGSVMQGSTVVEGLASFDGKVMSFQPRSVLLPDSVYTVTINGGVLDLAGNAMGEDYRWSFGTETVR